MSIDGTDMMAMRAQMNAFLPNVARARRVERRRRLRGSCGNSSAITSSKPTARRKVAGTKVASSNFRLKEWRIKECVSYMKDMNYLLFIYFIFT